MCNEIAGPGSLLRVLTAVLGVYTAQSLVGGFTFVGLPSVLRQQGVSLELIGFVSLLMVPWALKFLWSPAVERWRQPATGRPRTKTVIVTGQAIVVVMFVLVAFADPSALVLLGAGLATMAFVSASVDIACDAYTIENLPDKKRGLGNIAQVGGGYLGFVAGSGLFLFLVSYGNWTVGILAMAALVCLGSFPFVLIGREQKVAFDPSVLSARPSLMMAFKNPLVRTGIIISILFEMGIRLVMPLMSLYLVDRGAPLEWIGTLNGLGGAAAGLLGTLAGGLFVMRIGGKAALKMAVALQFLTLAALALAAIFNLDIVIVSGLIVASMVIMALGFVSVYSMTMDLASLKQAGVDFSIFQSVGALTAAVLGFSAAQIAHVAGYAVCFALAACFSLVALTVIPLLLKHIEAS